MKHKTFFLTALLAAILALATIANASTWKFDNAHSVISFSVKHMTISTVTGTFNTFDGTVMWDETKPDLFTAEATVETASIDTRNDTRDADLRSPKFFEVEKFPQLMFKSKRVEKIGDGRYKMFGDLTIRDVTKEVVFDVTGFQGTVKDMRGGMRTGAAATTTISRKDFGLTWNVPLEGGGVLVSDAVTISIDLELVKQEG